MKIRNVFAPNGVNSLHTIYTQAKSEYGVAINEPNNYSTLKMDLIRVLKMKKPSEIEEIYLDTIIGIGHLEQNDFSNFLSVRFAYWGMLITVATVAVGDIPIYQYFNMSKRFFGSSCIFVLLFLLISMSKTIHMQHDQMEYLKFKLICLDEIRNK